MDESTNSCGTRSFSCTAAADSPARADLSPPVPNGTAKRGSPDSGGALPAEGAALLRELDGLRAALAGAAGARPNAQRYMAYSSSKSCQPGRLPPTRIFNCRVGLSFSAVST